MRGRKRSPKSGRLEHLRSEKKKIPSRAKRFQRKSAEEEGVQFRREKSRGRAKTKVMKLLFTVRRLVLHETASPDNSDGRGGT